MITLYFTDGSLAPIGQPIVGWTQVDVTLRFNEPSSVTVQLPALGEYIEVAQPGNRLVVVRNGSVLCSGPVEFPAEFKWDAAGGENAEPGKLTVSATDDSVWLGERLTYPDPTVASNAQGTAYYTLTTTNAETAMRNLVNLNAGPGALASRQVANLALGSVASVGSNINVRTRFEPVSDALRAAAVAGGGLGYRVVESSGSLLFQVYAPVDRTGSVRFSRGLGNLRQISYQDQAPTATVAIVGGNGTGATRTIVERPSVGATPTPWGRMETFVNDSSSTTADLNQSGDDQLAQSAEQAQLLVTAIDTATQRYGVHYGLGDKVTVEIFPGVELADVVRAVHLSASPDDGEVVSPQIGADSTSTDQLYVRQLRALDRRLGQLERT
jgi:hypothetical protein